MKCMTHVLYVCPTSGIGGAETFVRTTWKFRDPELVANHYLLFAEGPLANDLRRLGATVEMLGFRPRLSRPWDHIRVWRRLRELIKKHSIDIVHSTMAYGAIFAAPACWLTGAKHLWFQHGPASGWMDQVAALLPHDVIAGNSAFTCQRQLSLEKPISFLVSRKRQLLQFTYGTEIPQLAPEAVARRRREIAEAHQLDPEAFWVSMVCRVQEWKGVHIFLEAFLELQNRSTAKPILGLIWGEAFKDDRYLKQLKSYRDQHRLPVHFMGATNEPQLVLAASDLLVNASIQPEPFGLSIIEAMAVGTPVLVPNEGGPAEIMANSKAGLTFHPRDGRDLAAKIAAMGERNSSGLVDADCVLETQQRFDARQSIHNLEAIYQRMQRA